MPYFNYKGTKQNGKDVTGQINAESIASAKQKIRAQGILLSEISEKKAHIKKLGSFNFGSGVNINELSLMTRQLATLVKAKIPLTECLSALSDQVDSVVLGSVLAEVKQKINEGSSLAKALSD